ncbi:MAG TPA: heme-binding protein [Terriglobales bacterium]|nr:heme-binding protein [Terriglobales bacterium]
MARTIVCVFLLAVSAWGQQKPAAGCEKIPDHEKLKAALQQVVKEGKAANSGMGNQEWATVVNRDGVVCAVVFSGPDRGSQWPGSRLISAEKANTANALSVDNFALSTANLYFASTPGQSLYSLATSAPPNPQAVFAGDPNKQGQADDPMVGKPIGGIIVFGGGLALYDTSGHIVGGLGVSGDTSCADHIVAWKVRHKLNYDTVPNGVASGPGPNDNMILDIQNGNSASGFGHPSCKGGQPPDAIIKELPTKFPTGKK